MIHSQFEPSRFAGTKFLQLSIAGCFAALLFWPVPASSRVLPRIALKDAAEVRGATIRLSDLLSQDAPDDIRNRAKLVSLGESPLPGSHRTIARSELRQALRKLPSLRGSLDFPARVEITRWSRPLTSQDVLGAISDALRSNRLTASEPLTAQNIAIGSPVEVSDIAPALRVTRIELAFDGSSTHVRLLVASEPRIPPFWVKIHQAISAPDSDSGSVLFVNLANPRHPAAQPAIRVAAFRANDQPAAHADGTRNESRPRGTESRQERRPEVLSSPADSDELGIESRSGQPMKLVLQIRDMKITMLAIPLDSGKPGERIRLRNPRTGNVFTGTVVSRGTVDVDY